MTHPTETMTDAELAEYYNTTGDLSEFDGGEEVAVDPAPSGTRTVTLSIRLSPEELETLADRAQAAGKALTAYIRTAALEAEQPVDTEAIREGLGMMETLLRKLVGQVGSSGQKPAKRYVKPATKGVPRRDYGLAAKAAPRTVSKATTKASSKATTKASKAPTKTSSKASGGTSPDHEP